MAINNYSQIQNTVFPASASLPQPVIRSADGKLWAYGTVVPVDGSAGYAKGCIFNNTNGTGENVLYYNAGTEVNSNFNVLDGVGNAFGTASGRGPSPAIWADCPVLNYELNPEIGMHYFDDFLDGVTVAANQSAAGSAALGTTGNFVAFTGATGASVISTLVTNYQGEVKLASTTINESMTLAYPKGAHTQGIFELKPGKRFWFEARVSFVNTDNSKFGAFIGFAEQALVADDTIHANTTPWALEDKYYVGFERLNADGDMLDTMFNNSDAGHITVGTDAVTIVAGAMKKIGMYCDGTNVYFYADGVRLADSTTLATTSFPVSQEMAFYFSMVMGHGDDASINIDWVKFAQEY